MDFLKNKLDLSRYTTPDKSKQTWEGVEVVDYFKTQFDIPEAGPFGYSSWLRRVKTEGVTLYHAKKIVEIMYKRENWVKETKGVEFLRGQWMFNRFRYDIKTLGVDKFISKNSR